MPLFHNWTLLASVASLVSVLNGPAGLLQEHDADTPASKEVIVTARKMRIDDYIRRVRQLSDSQLGQMTRFEEPICPQVVGLPESMSTTVEHLIGEEVVRAGATKALTTCTPNLIVIIAEDGNKFLIGLNKKNPGLFDGFYISQKDAFNKQKGPVWSWRTTIPKRRDGGPVNHISSISFSANDPPRPLGKGAYIVSDIEPGRLSAPVRVDMASAIIVINAQAVNGTNLRQLSAFCAMVGMSPINTAHAKDNPESSILSLFSMDDHQRTLPDDLSAFDLAYLRALYRGDTGYTFDQKTRMMATDLERELKSGGY